MDFTIYINSQDVREYHRKIDYKYSSLEAAWLVYMCDSITLSEKHRAWKWIINNMSDETIFLGDEDDYTKSVSLQGFLADCIDMDQAFIEYFTDETDDKVYLYDKSRIFNSWEKCVGYIIDNKTSDYSWPAFIRFCNLNDSIPYDSNGNIRINSDGKIKSVYYDLYSDYIYEKTQIELTILNFFQLITPEFPSPFKNGDILCCYEYRGRKIPFVYSTQNEGDESSLIYGYSVADSYLYKKSISGIKRSFGDNWDYMTNIEYYRKELKGKWKCLLPVSDWIKGKYNNDLALFLDDFILKKNEEYFETDYQN